jgi:hypothetical protein
VPADRKNRCADIIRQIGDNIQPGEFIPLMENIYDLRAYVLVNDRIQRLVPSEENTGKDQNDRISAHDVIPCRLVVFGGHPDRNKVGASGTGIVAENNSCRKTGNHTAEYGNQQNILGYGSDRKYGGQNRAARDKDTGIDHELMTDMAPEKKHREDIHREVNDTEADIEMKKLHEYFRQKPRQTAVPARKQIAALGEIIHSEGIKQ